MVYAVCAVSWPETAKQCGKANYLLVYEVITVLLNPRSNIHFEHTLQKAGFQVSFIILNVKGNT